MMQKSFSFRGNWPGHCALIAFCLFILAGCGTTVQITPLTPPAPLAIYYGQPSQINDAQGDVELAVAEFARFQVVVLGDGLAHPSHRDHADTAQIIRQLVAKGVEVYGYVDMGVSSRNLALAAAQRAVDEWNVMGVSGIFWDNGGDDFGVDRARQTLLIDYTHRRRLTAFVRAQNPADIFADDHGSPSPLVAGDWYLAPNDPVVNGKVSDLRAWWHNSQRLDTYRKQSGVRIAALATGDDAPTGWANAPAYRLALWAAYLFAWDGFGFTNPQYSASGARVNRLRPLPQLFTKPGTMYLSPPIQIDAQTYLRATDAGVIRLFGDNISGGRGEGGGTFQGGACNTAALNRATSWNSAIAGHVIWPNCSTMPPVQSSPYGPRQKASEGFRYDWHRGVDIPQPAGAPVYAMQDGVVRLAGSSPAYTDLVVQIRHRSGAPYLYSNVLHMQTVLVAAGDLVTVGDLIGYSGTSESGFGHMHFEVREGCIYQECNRNPWGYLPYPDQMPTPPILRGATLTANETLLLLDVSTPGNELDFDGVTLTWSDTLTTSLELLDASTDRDFPQGLDHPVVDLGEGAALCLLPGRFNGKQRAATYSFAYTGLPPNGTGHAATLDLQRTGPSINLVPTTSDIIITRPAQTKIAEVGQSVHFHHRLQNQGATPVKVNVRARSAQHYPLTVSHKRMVLEPGAAITVAIGVTLSATAPVPNGDCLLLEFEDGSGQSLIAIDVVTTSATRPPRLATLH